MGLLDRDLPPKQGVLSVPDRPHRTPTTGSLECIAVGDETVCCHGVRLPAGKSRNRQPEAGPGQPPPRIETTPSSSSTGSVIEAPVKGRAPDPAWVAQVLFWRLHHRQQHTTPHAS